MKLSIDSPCHENWDQMTPNEQGAFCLSCQKNVVDFSTKSLNEIKSFFQELPLAEKVCGRFEETQLEALSFDDFFKRFRKWRLFHKMAVVCFFVFGLSLFSCSQTPMENEPVIMGDIAIEDTLTKQAPAAVPQNTITPKQYMLGGPRVIPTDTSDHKTKSKPVEKIKVKGEVYVEPETPKTKCTIETQTLAVFTTGMVVMNSDTTKHENTGVTDSTLVIPGKENRKIMGKMKRQ